MRKARWYEARGADSALALVGNTRPIAQAHHLQHRPNNLGNTVGPLTLALSLWEREGRLLFLQHLLDQRIGFRHVPVHEEGEH